MPFRFLLSMLRPRCVSVLTGVLLSAVCVSAQAQPKVAASISPLQLIAAAVMDGVSEPILALGAGQDPHSISLRPSERRTLADADLVLWIGPALELPLEGVLRGETTRLLTVQDIDGLNLREAGNEPDPHLWLSLGNVEKIAASLAERLAQLDPDNAARYLQNNEHFASSLAALRAGTQQQAASSSVQAWAVYHHAFAYIEHELNLPPALSLTDSHGNMAGVRTMMSLRESMQKAGLGCLVAEPGVDEAKVRNLLDMPALRIEEVDIMGAEEKPDAQAYARLYEKVLSTILHCSVSAEGEETHDH